MLIILLYSATNCTNGCSLLRSTFFAPTLLLLAMLAGCASEEADLELLLETSEKELYDSAQRSLRSNNFENAIARLQQLEARFPFGRYARQAQLELIYAYYRSRRTEEAQSASDRFTRLHPNHPNVDYALYLKALSQYEQDAGILDHILPRNQERRDPGLARESFKDFAELIQRFPDSAYAPDAQQRMIYLKNRLASYEINVARYYMRRGAYVAAANRGRHVLENFQGTPSVPDGLAIMAEAYSQLEMTGPAEDALQVLQDNYPDHPFLSGESENRPRRGRSALRILTFGIVK